MTPKTSKMMKKNLELQDEFVDDASLKAQEHFLI